jgi:predicted dehydrogenase
MNNDRPTNSSNNPSRRSFLASAAAVAGTAAFVGLAQGREPLNRIKPGKSGARAALAKDAPVRMAVIGTGGMGTGHVHAFLDLTKAGRMNVEVVALSDVNKLHLETAQKAAQEKQGGKTVDTYGNYKELLARPDIHGVLIASPEHWHSKMAVDAILAGKDTYLEKPMTLNLQDAFDVYDTVNANPDLIFQVGTQGIQIPKFTEAGKVIKSGLIGKATFSQTSYCRNSKDGEWNYYKIDDRWKPGENLDWDAWCGPIGKMAWDAKRYIRWRRYRKLSTGIIGDLLVHEITPMLYAIRPGWPVEVKAIGSHLIDTEMENHDLVNIQVIFENGHQMIISGSTNNEVGLEKIVRGNKGNIYLNGRHCVVRPERVYSEDFDEKTIECPDIGNDQDMHRVAWIDSIRSREKAKADVELGTQVMTIVDLATRSIWDGHGYRFDPKTFQVTQV